MVSLDSSTQLSQMLALALVTSPQMAKLRAVVLDYHDKLGSAQAIGAKLGVFQVRGPSLSLIAQLLQATGRSATGLPPHTIRVGACVQSPRGYASMRPTSTDWFCGVVSLHRHSYMDATEAEVLTRWYIHDWVDVPEWQVYRDSIMLHRVRPPPFDPLRLAGSLTVVGVVACAEPRNP